MIAVLAGCGDDDVMGMPDAGGIATPEGVPCEAGRVIAERCLRCHTDPPRFGAPVALTDAAAFAEDSSEEGESIAVRALDRIHRTGGGRMPPASQQALTPDELDALSAWLEAGAPRVEDMCGGEGPPPVCVGPDCLPCEPTHSFVSEGDGPGGSFHVPASGNPYACIAFPSPFAPGDQATAWAPIVDDARVVHHWLLYRTPSEPDLGTGCEMPVDAVGLMGWAPGGENSVLPDDVGLELATNEGEWLILQIHYWNVAGHEDAFDQSGVAICTADTPRENTAAIITVGTTAVGVAPRARGAVVQSTCPSASTLLLSEPLNVLAATPHMHRLGTQISTEILPAGVDIRSRSVVAVDPFSFDDQRAIWLDEPEVIRPGDAIRTTCTYDNPTDEWVYFGERSEDEMCFDFLLVYPIEAWPRGYGRTCLSAIGL